RTLWLCHSGSDVRLFGSSLWLLGSRLRLLRWANYGYSGPAYGYSAPGYGYPWPTYDYSGPANGAATGQPPVAGETAAQTVRHHRSVSASGSNSSHKGDLLKTGGTNGGY